MQFYVQINDYLVLKFIYKLLFLFVWLFSFLEAFACIYTMGQMVHLVLCKHCSCVGGWKTLFVLSNLGLIFLIRQCVVSIFSNGKHIRVKHLHSLLFVNLLPLIAYTRTVSSSCLTKAFIRFSHDISDLLLNCDA